MNHEKTTQHLSPVVEKGRTAMKTKPLRLALVGGGAVSQQGYLPALASVPEVHCRFLVDVNKELAAALAKKWRIPEFTDDYDRALEAVEAVVLTVLRSVYLS